jgi:succinate-acetate transporter protein
MRQIVIPTQIVFIRLAPPIAGLVQERVPDILGQLAYFSILLLLSLATVLVCVAKIVQDHKVPRTDAPEYSQYLLPIAWAVYNMVGPILFFCAACLKKTRTLEMAMSLLIVVSCSARRMP